MVSTDYGEALSIAGTPTRKGFAFNGWTVSQSVSENGQLFLEGAPFALSTPITADLGLTAQWKHVHNYGCYQISAFEPLPPAKIRLIPKMLLFLYIFCCIKNFA